MKYLKIFSRSLLYISVSILLFTMIITILSYFNIISEKTSNFFLMIFSSISLIIGGFILGKSTKSKRWLEGLKLGFSVTILFILFSILILKYHFKISNFIYYVILIISCMVGSILGRKNKKD